MLNSTTISKLMTWWRTLTIKKRKELVDKHFPEGTGKLKTTAMDTRLKLYNKEKETNLSLYE